MSEARGQRRGVALAFRLLPLASLFRHKLPNTADLLPNSKERKASSRLIPVRRRVDVPDGDAEVTAGRDEHRVRSPGQLRGTCVAGTDTFPDRLRTIEEVGGLSATHVH